jgi:hypothetical protein
MLIDFCVDIWFCYGSFSYGFESDIFEFSEDELQLSLHADCLEHTEHLTSFFEQLVEKSKGLLRVELRVYGPEKILKHHNISVPVYLFTDIIPKKISYPDKKSLVLKFSSLKGISPSNAENWHKIVCQIWSQMPKKLLQKS